MGAGALPWPHLLFRGDWRERAGSVDHPEDGEAQAVMRSMVLGLTPAEVAACAYRRPDWGRAADTVVALVERTGELAFQDLRRAGALDGRRDPAGLLQPQVGSDRPEWRWPLVNGEHRFCAMKLAGVSRCPIVAF